MSQEEIDEIYAQIKRSEQLLKKAKADVMRMRRTLRRSTVDFKIKPSRPRH